MAKNINWTSKDLKDKKLIEVNGSYVKAETQISKKVEKINNHANDLVTAFGYSMRASLDPYQNEDKEVSALIVSNGIDKVQQYLQRPHDPNFINELQEIAKYYYSKILTELTTVKVKPLSTNKSWKGRRFKTTEHLNYCNMVSLLLPNKIVVPEGLLKVEYIFGVSSRGFDWDNGLKSFQDILSKKYKFNDNRIMEAKIRKVIVKKGDEFVKFRIESL